MSSVTMATTFTTGAATGRPATTTAKTATDLGHWQPAKGQSGP